MEGLGSRLGRASSRYGPTATTTVFNGPVRKWEKKWVHVAPSSPSATTNAAQSNGGNSAASSLLLRRWTPLPLAAGEDDVAGEPDGEPPRRKFRYTPIAVLEEQKKVLEKPVEDEPKTVEKVRSPVNRTASNGEEKDLEKETKAVTEKDMARDLEMANNNDV